MNFIKITNEYYSRWFGVAPETFNSKGVIFIASPERDKIQNGYPCIFDIYAYRTQSQIIISYSKRLSDKIEKIKDKIQSGMTVDEVAIIMETGLNTPVGRIIKFFYNEIPDNTENTNAVQLSDNHYYQYHKFFMTQYKSANADGWLEEYFHNINRNGYAFGIFEDNKLICVSDAPSMPYMHDKVQEIGINTLPEYRGKGHAKSVALSCIKAIIASDRCPQWSCAASNIASERLAYSVGFHKFADILTLSI